MICINRNPFHELFIAGASSQTEPRFFDPNRTPRAISGTEVAT
jgi:hypothetical protein